MFEDVLRTIYIFEIPFFFTKKVQDIGVPYKGFLLLCLYHPSVLK